VKRKYGPSTDFSQSSFFTISEVHKMKRSARKKAAPKPVPEAGGGGGGAGGAKAKKEKGMGGPTTAQMKKADLAASKKLAAQSRDRNRCSKLPYGSPSHVSNQSLASGKAPLAIDYFSLATVEIPPDWGRKEYATNAAKQVDRCARLMGCVTIKMTNMGDEDVMELVEENDVDDAHFNVDGEFYTPQGQIPLGRIMDRTRQLAKHSQDIVNHLYALQCPASSQWKLPFIRLLSNHSYNASTESITVKYYVYFTR